MSAILLLFMIGSAVSGFFVAKDRYECQKIGSFRGDQGDYKVCR